MAIRSQAKLRTHLSAVEDLLAEQAPDDSNLSALARQVFEAGSYEDLAPFAAEELVVMAREMLDFIGKRQRGRHKLRIVNPDLSASDDRRAYSVIEIANDDMPFLLESLLSELADRSIEVFLVLHPIIWVSRTTDGKLETVYDADAPSAERGVRESVIHVHIEQIAGKEACDALTERIKSILNSVRTVVLDWRLMRSRLETAITAYQTNPPPVPVDELAETIQFLQWLAQDHFTFLGVREFLFEGEGEDADLVEVEGSGLGVLRDPEVRVLRRGTEMVSVTPEVREFLMQPAPLIVTKANVKAEIHRRAYMDYVGIKQFDENGQVTGELRLIGLFTSAAYTRSARNIPFLRRKVDLVLSLAGYEPASHSGRALANVLESYPRDELFQIDIDTLVEFSLGILQLAERPRTRLFVRHDKFDRFVSILVFVPRDSYDTSVRIRIGEILCDTYEGRLSAFYPAYPEGTLARVHFIIGRYSGERPEVDVTELEGRIAQAARGWDDSLKDVLESARKPAAATRLFERYRGAFSPAYHEFFAPEIALADINKMETLSPDSALALELIGQDGSIHLMLYHLAEPIALSDRLPILENMGFRAIKERSFEVNRRVGDGRECIWLHDITLEFVQDGEIDHQRVFPLIEEGFLAIWYGEAEDDRYNRLMPAIGASWREVSVLRAVGKYLQQAGIPFSQDYMAETLRKHASIASMLLDMFQARLDPADRAEAELRAAKADQIAGSIETALDDVSVLDEDRIIRRFVNIIQAMQRTNYYQRGSEGDVRPAIAFKLNSSAIDGLPKPVPFAEIFVYSPRVEGVHLRGGAIARGGLRWSDRPQDFRTEVLGLAKAQQVKNAVIVPVGAKGGFVPKRLAATGSREEWFAEGKACYKVFIGSLLDVTDNLDGDKVAPPSEVVRHDGDDPYLVVAADKGTATFSDTANGISTERGFWLGDAFASGGSAGYDHKKMGITARGAWEAVKRHFREMDHDIQAEPFTVIGCGDMSGDVFGNGMLLSKQTKLIAAFDHRDIFIDPDPDPAKSYAERRRLFKLARSSWADYNADLISSGGGVFSRSLKSIKLTKAIKDLTGLTQDRATPNELIRALLRAPIDLLWFGGIGTYVRASAETDEQAGDRANDALRITAAELRTKVVGEGANLGLTQRARIEFARAGGRLNSDAIDNSAGVNSSDLEVNIKIALGNAIQSGALKSDDRNALLADMTDEVARLVLRNNYEQTLCLSLACQRGLDDLTFQTRLMKELESRELLDRAVEDLPDDVEIAERLERGEGLARPELAVLLAYGKITLFRDLLESAVPDDAYLSRELIGYFPVQMREAYRAAIEAHRLRREIIATMLSNSIINRGGSTMIQRLRDETGADVDEIVSAFALARDSFELEDLFDEIDALDNKLPNAVQSALYLEMQTLIRRQTVWFLRHVDHSQGLEPLVAHFRDGIAGVDACLAKALPDEHAELIKQRETELTEQGVPKKLAKRVAVLPALRRAPDVVAVADATGKPVEKVAPVFFALGDTLRIDWLLQRAEATAVPEYYDRLALNRVTENIASAQRRLTTDAFTKANGAKDVVKGWLTRNRRPVDRARGAVDELVNSGSVSLSKLSVASAYMHDLADG